LVVVVEVYGGWLRVADNDTALEYHRPAALDRVQLQVTDIHTQACSAC